VILVDTSAWIDYLSGKGTAEAALLDSAIGNIEIAVGDLILTEIMQGVRDGAPARVLAAKLAPFRVLALGGEKIALAAASNYRLLRSRGLTIRGTIDVIIATWCIENRVPLLHNDRDFSVMETELGLPCYGG